MKGLSLHPKSKENVELTCDDLNEIAKGATGTVACSPASALTTAQSFILVAASATVGSVFLIVDENLKLLLLILIIRRNQEILIKMELEIFINFLLFY